VEDLYESLPWLFLFVASFVAALQQYLQQ